MQYTIDHFIEKFEKIPANMFITGDYTRGTKHCAEGWCRNHEGGFPDTTRESLTLLSLSIKYLRAPIAYINDGYHPDFKQKTIKGRIMAALKKIKEKSKIKK